MLTEDQRKEIIRKQAHIEFLWRIVIAAGTLLVITFMCAMLYSIHISQQQRDQIISCTTPRGACAVANQKRTADVVSQIVLANQNNSKQSRQVVVYAAFCAMDPQNQTVTEVEKCVRKLLVTRGDMFHYKSHTSR